VEAYFEFAGGLRSVIDLVVDELLHLLIDGRLILVKL
jgi:hypothetical protein